MSTITENPLSNYKGLIPDGTTDLEPLSEIQVKAMMMCVFAKESEQASNLWKAILQDLLGAQIMNSKLVAAGREGAATDALKALVALLSKRAGDAVMWAYTLCYMEKALGRQATVGDWSSLEYFGMGVPTEDFMHKRWEEQKNNGTRGDLESDNYIDNPSLWPVK